MVRIAGNRGRFYPDRCSQIEEMIAGFDHLIAEHISDQTYLSLRPRAVIVPHAGYVYSGFTANIAYRLLSNSAPKRVIVIGPSHHLYFEGISGSMLERYETPCGDLPIDGSYLSVLAAKYPIVYIPEVHRREHSTETQMPFVRHYLPESSVVELVYGADIDYQVLASLIDELLQDPLNAVVISSDLSHFHTLEQAQRLDNICLMGITQKAIQILDNGCEACGLPGLKAITEAAHKNRLSIHLLDYRTSADTTGDTQNVVGYMSAAVF